MTRKLTFAVLASVMLAACQKENAPGGEIKNEEAMPKIKIEQGHLVFDSRASFDKLFQLPEQTRTDLLIRFESSPEFTSFNEKGSETINSNQRIINGCDVPDSLIEDNDDLFRTLDNNGVVQIGSDLYRYDYCNDKVFIIAFAIAYQGNNYNDFLSGNTSNSNVGWFPTYVDVLDAVAEGYRTMPDPKTVENNDTFKQGAPGNQPLHEGKYFYDMDDDESLPSNTRMDGKLSYDKFGIYFHFYGKEKYQRYGWLGWQTMRSGTTNWLVNYQYQYKRKGQSNMSGNGTLNPPSAGSENKVEKTFYSGSKGLEKYLVRWDVRNFTTYHSVTRKSAGNANDAHIGTYQTFPANTPMNVYNYSFNIIINSGNPSYYQIIYGY